MRVRVLGAAAGGGLPQWNCGCGNCGASRTGALPAATQASLAVQSDPASWVLLNAAPDVRAQLASCAQFWPRAGRESPVVAVVLSSGELDHCLGLLSLREAQPFAVYATGAVRDGLCSHNAMLRALEPQVTWRLLPLGREVEIVGRRGEATGLAVEARAVPGGIPRHLRGLVAPGPEHVVALRVRDLERGGRLAYCPCAGRVDEQVETALDAADCVFFDGTFWSSDEVPRAGGPERRAEAMGHAPLAGPEGALARLGATISARRRILTHLNNTNPLFDPRAPERRVAGDAGWEIAHDGLEIAV